jgi:hypothetical protein
MSIKSAEKSHVCVQATALALKIIKTDPKSTGIAAAGLFYNKV